MVNLDLPILNRVKNILTKTEKIDTDVTSVLTKLAEQGVDIDSIIKSIGTSGDQASAATLFGKLAGLASQSGGAVKSVQVINVGRQRVIDYDQNMANAHYKDFNISAVNIDKTIVLSSFAAVVKLNNTTQWFGTGSAKLQSNNKVRVYANVRSSNDMFIESATVQIIEFL